MTNDNSTTRLVMLYPLWLRVWHWSNALLFVLLVVSGISLHFAGPQMPLIPFRTARSIHNVSGLLMCAGYLFYVINNFRSNNIRHYIPVWQGLVGRLVKQATFYGVGIFKGEHHPIPPTEAQKFNPLQQLTYVAVMFVAIPVLIITGVLLLVPEYAPEQFLGMGGLWPIAVLHYLIGIGLTAFLISHVYLITTGETLTHDLKKMIHGMEKIAVKKEDNHENPA
ncbi:MAG: cytochrome b/b6 domain-containing protein [Magnetococcales bacterium]|nr:cytochrome b/b6 domain-containing protein [Magnetococcales bacterium]